MKFLQLLSAGMLLLFFTACSTTKTTGNKENLFNNTWELEFISGPRIAFEGLFPDKKPQLTFNRLTQEVTGTDGCNGYTSSYKVSGDSISFGVPGPTTLMYCGEGEKIFLAMLKNIKTYNVDENGKLNFLYANIPMMRFKRVMSR